MQKKFMWLLAVPLIGILACTVLTANAGAKESVSLSADGSQAEVTLEVPDEMVREGERIVSLQLSFQVDAKQGSIGAEDISFEFHEGIGSAVKEERYDPKSGVLNIYISGGNNLYSGQEVPLGKVVLKSGSGSGKTATVRVVPNSLKTVNAAHGTRAQGVNAPGSATLVAGDGGSGNVPETPGSPGSSSGSPGEEGGPGGSVVGNYAGNVTLGAESQDNGGNISLGIQRPGGIHVSQGDGGPEESQTLPSEDGETGSGLEEGEQENALPDTEMSFFRKKLYAIDMDGWTKIFIWVMVVMAVLITGISLVLLLGNPGKCRKRRERSEVWEDTSQRERTEKKREAEPERQGKETPAREASKRRPEKAEAQAPKRRPEKAEAQTPKQRPEKAEAQALKQKPEKAEAQTPKRRPERAEAQAPKRRPEKAEAQTPKRRPEKAEAQTPKQKPERAEAQAPKRRSEKAEAQTPKRRPERAEAQAPKRRPEKAEAQAPKRRPENTGTPKRPSSEKQEPIAWKQNDGKTPQRRRRKSSSQGISRPAKGRNGR